MLLGRGGEEKRDLAVPGSLALCWLAGGVGISWWVCRTPPRGTHLPQAGSTMELGRLQKPVAAAGVRVEGEGVWNWGSAVPGFLSLNLLIVPWRCLGGLLRGTYSAMSCCSAREQMPVTGRRCLSLTQQC